LILKRGILLASEAELERQYQEELQREAEEAAEAARRSYGEEDGEAKRDGVKKGGWASAKAKLALPQIARSKTQSRTANSKGGFFGGLGSRGDDDEDNAMEDVADDTAENQNITTQLNLLQMMLSQQDGGPIDLRASAISNQAD
jgi:hypothetical protein